MFATRDQENVFHDHQTAAAAKPLNRGVRGVAPKTPGNNGGKVTFGNLLTTRKISNKDDENVNLIGTKKGGNAEKPSFITPLAQKDRAPLGAKTTNANAHVFKTPAPGLQKTQKRSTSSRKTKLKIHQPDAITSQPVSRAFEEEEDNVPDIEYCPPKITPLPDLPDDPYIFTDDYESPLLDHPAMLANVYSYYQDNIIEADGRSRRQREADEDDAAYELRRDEECRIQAEQLIWGTSEVLGVAKKDKIASRTPSSRLKPTGPSSLEAKTAALALSAKPQVQLPHFAAPTAATRAKSSKVALAPTTIPSPRASIASRTTIGYSKGRKVSATLRPGAIQTQKAADKITSSKEGKASAGCRSEDEILQELLREQDHESGEDGEGEEQGLRGANDRRIQLPWEEEEEDEVFQLDPALFQI